MSSDEIQVQVAREEEDRVLSTAVTVALHTFMGICNDEDNSEEIRMEAARCILGYAATFQPDVSMEIRGGDDADDDEPADE